MKFLLAYLCLLSLVSCNGSRYAYDEGYWGGYNDDGYYYDDHYHNGNHHDGHHDGHHGGHGGGHGGGHQDGHHGGHGGGHHK